MIPLKSVFLPAAIFFIAVVCMPHLAQSQTDEAPPLPTFKLLVETHGDGIKLTCSEGCGWKELLLTFENEKPQVVDQYGLSSLDRPKPAQGSQLTNFLITVYAGHNGVEFTGVEGTAWNELTFSCPGGQCSAKVDQNGLTSPR